VLVGPVFARELITLPRRPRPYVARAAVVGALLVLMSTAWQVLAGTQIVRTVGDFSRFGTIVFQVLAPLQLTAIVFFAALTTAAGVAYEKDRRTFDLLLLTNLSNSELVLGKLCAALAGVANVLLATTPIFVLTMLLGGVGLEQVLGVLAVTAAAMFTAGSLGSTIALWREKTYQTLAATALTIVVWTGAWEAVARGTFGEQWGATTAADWAVAASPWHAVQATMRPFSDGRFVLGPFHSPATAQLACACGLIALLNLTAIARVRVWNPTREIMPRSLEDTGAAAAPHPWSLSAMRAAHAEAATANETAAPQKSSAVAGRGLRRSRTVWDNPILWRETMTWAYGRKVVFIRLVFLLVGLAAAASLWRAAFGNTPTAVDPAVAVVPLAVLAALLINMQAVTAVTSERDARALDLLLVTDLTPKEFIFGKLGGILYNAKEMVLVPVVLCGLLWYTETLTGETCLLAVCGWLTAVAFTTTLGLHVGMHYAESRSAVAVSLGTVFFLVVGIAVSMRIMVAFSGSFQAQLQPFLATIVGGGVGLYAALGRRNPSPAITAASFLLPLATFYAITSYLLDAPLATFLAVVGAYGFATAALLVPAVFEFDVATGRTTGGGDEA
jgi:ABC-type transport system involved in multi-copper enzyme maturation permease subunit